MRPIVRQLKLNKNILEAIYHNKTIPNSSDGERKNTMEDPFKVWGEGEGCCRREGHILSTGNVSAQNLQFGKVSEDLMDSFVDVRHFYDNTVVS